MILAIMTSKYIFLMIFLGPKSLRRICINDVSVATVRGSDQFLLGLSCGTSYLRQYYYHFFAALFSTSSFMGQTLIYGRIWLAFWCGFLRLELGWVSTPMSWTCFLFQWRSFNWFITRTQSIIQFVYALPCSTFDFDLRLGFFFYLLQLLLVLFYDQLTLTIHAAVVHLLTCLFSCVNTVIGITFE